MVMILPDGRILLIAYGIPDEFNSLGAERPTISTKPPSPER